MKKILLVVVLSLIGSIAFASPWYGLTITSVHDVQFNTFVGLINPRVDGDYQWDRASGGYYEMNDFIHTEKTDAKGNLYIGTTFFDKETQCSISAKLVLPLKVVKDHIELPQTSEYKLDQLKFSDEKCRALGYTHFYITIENSGWRYIIKSFAAKP